MDKVDKVLGTLCPDEQAEAARRLIRRNCLPMPEVYREAEKAVTSELEKALVNFFYRVNLLDHYITEPADNCGTWCVFTVQAAMGQDHFIRPFLEEASRWKEIRHSESSSTHADRYLTILRDGHLPRAKDWREWWERGRARRESHIARLEARQTNDTGETTT